MRTRVMEDYLKAIFKLEEQDGRVGTTDLAKALKLKPASVTTMLQKLSRLRLVHYRPHQGVELLPAGKKIALEIIRHHRLLELYLKEALGYTWDCVHDEAEKLEHYISEEFEEKIFQSLGCPEFDPHGDPIPTKEGKIREVPAKPLSQAPTGKMLQITRVDDSDSKLLRYFEKIGLVPGTQIEILEKSPFDGPFAIRVGKQKHSVGFQILDKVFATTTAHEGHNP